jgi:hypothetical protein
MSVRIEQEDRAMSSSNHSLSWMETWWPLGVILFGLTFLTILVSFNPH